ncbi:MAG: TonB-dependent receptor [Bacteroidales bacterium]|nr:TonB-dependent receptor [Bacteroidales bacterium]
MKIVKILLISVCTMLISSVLYGQTGVITGRVSDLNGEGLYGTNVVVKGTAIGVITDFDGNYSIQNVPVGQQTVEFSFIGMTTQENIVYVESGKTVVIDVVLLEDAVVLEDVVVIGYGRRQKRDVTGAITSISSDDFGDAVLPSLESSMQGRAAGVQVTTSNGMAGSSINVKVRGTNSISAGSQPLYVIDGIPVSNGDFSANNTGSGFNALADLNPNDIESIQILKDAAAASIYGSRGANGVVLITTKKGSAGKTKFNVNYYSGFVEAANTIDLLSAEQHLALRDSARVRRGLEPESKESVIYNPSTGIPITRGMADSIAALGGTDWIDLVLRPGFVQEISASAQGGNDKTNFYTAMTYRDEEGFVLGNSYDRLSGRINVENKATDKLSIGTNMSVSYSNNKRVPTGDAGGLGLAQQKLPYLPVFNDDGTYYDPYSNPLWQLENWHFTANTFRSISGVYLNYDILDNLSFRSEFGVDFMNLGEDEFRFRNVQDTGSVSSAWDRRTNVFNYTTNNYFTYNQKIGTGQEADFTLGHSYQRSSTSGVGLNGWDFPNDNLTSPGSADPSNMSGYSYSTAFAFDSYFFRVNYKLKNRYLAGFSIRTDGSSRFGEDNRYGTFPAVSAGWIISDESFMKSVKNISFLKLRASYGLTGNANIDDYAHLGFYSAVGGYNGASAIVPSTLLNPSLSWEKSIMLDINIDYGFFDNRLSGSITYYNKQSSDLLLQVTLPSSSGYSKIWQNIGALTNNGVEFDLTSHNFQGDFKWTTNFNIAYNQNEVTDVGGLPPDAFDNKSGGDARVILGYPVGIAYLVEWAGVQQEDGELPLWNTDGTPVLDDENNQVTAAVEAGTELYYDANGNLMTYANPTGDFYGDNRKPFGSPFPKIVGGITNTFNYKGFDLNFLFVYQYGNTIYDDQAKRMIGDYNSIAQLPEILDAYSDTNPSSEVPGLNEYSTYVNSTRFLYDASFIRLKNLSIGYSFNKKVCDKLKLGNMRIYVSGNNLWTLTKYKGWDPEVARNTSASDPDSNVSFAAPSFATPQARTIIGGIQISF